MSPLAACAADALLAEDRAERAAPALASTYRNLTSALALTHRPSAATLDRVADGMAARARSVDIARVRTGARNMIREPWRLNRVLMDAQTRPLDVLMHDCLVRIAGERQRGRENHWTYDGNRLVALRQAALALRFVRRFGEVT